MVNSFILKHPANFAVLEQGKAAGFIQPELQRTQMSQLRTAIFDQSQNVPVLSVWHKPLRPEQGK